MPQHQPVRILVVEDHAEFLRVIAGTLRRRADCQIFEASDGLEAVQKIEELQPNLILLDINLPGLHGFHVAERIPELAPQASFLFLSQESSADIVRKALSLGARGYIHKASIAIDLLTAVDAALAGQRFLSRSVASIEPLHRHEIRFCPDDTALVEALTGCIAAALGAGDSALAVVTESHRPSILQGLRALGVDIDRVIEQGTYLSLDADEALDLDSFRDAVNRLRRAAARAGKTHPRVTLCGERAGRLWAAGRTAEAVQLEQLCCDEFAYLGDILCVYPVPRTYDDPALARICAGHTAVFAD